MRFLTWSDDATARSVVFGGAWLTTLRLLDTTAATTGVRTGDEESFAVVLSGTHDLFAASGQWARRGLRATPWSEDRPCAVFLPPATTFRAANGEGHILVVGSRQPVLPDPVDPRERLSRRPLLPLAGSGKSFDPVAGAWKPAESFLGSAEAILPRRIERIETDTGVQVQRIAGADYKALSLRLDEAIVPAGASYTPNPPTGADQPVEHALFMWPRGTATVNDLKIEAVSVCTGSATPPTIRALDDACYVLAIYAGPKRIAR